MPPPDNSLLKLSCPKVLAGYESTVSRLFRTKAEQVRRFFSLRLRCTEDAKDAAQELFLRLWVHEKSGGLREDASGYMNAAAANLAVDIGRRRQARAFDRHESWDGQELSLGVDASEDLHWREGLEALLASLQQLPETTQQVFLLYHFDNLSHAEIAARLAVSTRTVERHIVRAMKHCKECIGDYL